MSLIKEIKVPLIAVNDTSLTVVELSFADGASVKKGDTVMIFETSKTTYNVEAEEDGFIQYFCETGSDYEVNEVVAKIFSEAADIVITPQKPVSKNEQKQAVKTNGLSAQEPVWNGDTLFSNRAITLMHEKGIDAGRFQGKDFVSETDVKELLGIATPAKEQQLKNKIVKPAAAVPVQFNDRVIIEKLSSNKKREIQFLSEVQAHGLTSTINTYVEAEGFFVHVNRSLNILKDTLLPVIVYETARALKKYPALNAFYNEGAIAFYNDVHVGFAIDIDKGLKVLRIPSTANKSLHEIEDAVLNLSEKYLNDELAVDDLTDVTFTITDLSSEAVAFFRPLINAYNSAILGVSSVDEKLNRYLLSLTFDHRVTEGKLAAVFLAELKQRLESYCSKNTGWPVNDVACYKCFKKLSEDLADTGFVKCITPSGKEGFICQSCFKGF